MHDVAGRLAQLNRPRILVEAARLGLPRYDRRRDLPGLLGHPARPGAAVMSLMEMEAEMDDSRRAAATGYAPLRHLSVLTALMAEADSLRTRDAQVR
ncbi:hypothetical protein GCM10011360_11820 [Primorskyibacter flagellatus]|uniref:Uncharacterized protein n=1 Tax=Primorskyibacter flagellatus TaxID=1387277 RepID=A0A917A4T2_9RHOB|nr:DUF6477 family protein [Primorskyibacter flagellatus]GGE25059.1 hypothetical protein GCM10011360_11820 [Primorskyibacter flagellatus]